MQDSKREFGKPYTKFTVTVLVAQGWGFFDTAYVTSTRISDSMRNLA